VVVTADQFWNGLFLDKKGNKGGGNNKPSLKKDLPQSWRYN